MTNPNATTNHTKHANHAMRSTATEAQAPFSGLWLPLITPFRNHAVDHTALARLVQHYGHTGVSGLIACGSTGEAAALDEAEQLAVLDTVLDTVQDTEGKGGLQRKLGLPVVMGLSGYHLAQTLAWVKVISSRPVAGLLVPAPHYIRPSQAGLLHWFQAIADASAVPLIVYDIPARTGVSINIETLLQLAQHPNIKAVKDCGDDTAKTHALIADGRLAVLAGNDLQLFSTMALGGAGAIAASAHVHTGAFVDVVRLLQQDKLHAARARWMPLVPVIESMFAEPNPASIKAALARDGWIANELRAPMMGAA
jgi:4-hydroxy-tetrahydrodipicolinate synthase